MHLCACSVADAAPQTTALPTANISKLKLDKTLPFLFLVVVQIMCSITDAINRGTTGGVVLSKCAKCSLANHNA